MFDAALIRRIDDESGKIDLGRLADTLLFFRKTQLTLNAGSLGQLVTAIGPETVLELIDCGTLGITIFHQYTAVQRSIENNLPLYSFVLFQFSGHKDKLIKSPKKAAHVHFEECMRREGISRRDQNRLLDRIPLTSLNRRVDIREDVYNACEAAITKSPQICDYAARIQIEDKFGIADNRTYFRPIKLDRGFVFDTNIDFSRLNQNQTDRTKWTLTEENILAYLFETQLDLALAASYQSGLVTVDGHARLIEARTDHLVRNAMRSSREVESFQEFLLPNLKSVREAINSGERSFADFLKVLGQAEKFKAWISNANPDQNLISEYTQAVTKSDFFDRVPSKAARFSLFAGGGALLDAFGAGGVGTAVGLGLSAIDMFILDKLLRGWKPSHFVEGQLKSFVSPKGR
jgi:hypothetical protein